MNRCSSSGGPSLQQDSTSALPAELEADSRLKWSRREILAATLAFGARPISSLAEISHEDPFTHVFKVSRDDDLLQLEFHFVRWIRSSEAGEETLRPLGTGDSLVKVRFPPQNLAEAIFEEKHALKEKDQPAFENDPLPIPQAEKVSENDPRPRITSYLSGPSWLVFRAGNSDEVRLDVDQWLRLLERLDLNVAAGATGPWTPRPPAQDETRLEIPYRLYISPEPDTEMSSTQGKRPERVPQSRFREMWHASLKSRRPVKPAPPPEGMEEENLPEDLKEDLKPPRSCALHARALWSPDYQAVGEPPFSRYYPAQRPLSLHALTRHRLVKQMAAGDGWIDAEHLILTALGADASLHYNSQKPIQRIIEEQLAADGSDAVPDPGTELRMWKHRIVIGRDVFFAEAFFGFLLPLYFPAVYVEITKRKFVSVADACNEAAHPPGAYLLKRRFILVIGDQQHFGSSASAIGRAMPQKDVRLKMLRSPDLADPARQMGGGDGDFRDPKEENPKAGIYFFPKDVITNEIIHWPMEMFDESGKSAEPSRAWLFFASNIVAGHRIYRSDKVKSNQRTFLFPGSKVSLAPEKARLLVSVPPGVDEEDAIADLPANVLQAAEKLGEELEKKLVGLREDISAKGLDIGATAARIRMEIEQARKDAEAAVVKELEALGTTKTEGERVAKETVAAAVQPTREALKKAEHWYQQTQAQIGDKRAKFMTAWGDVVTQLRRAKTMGATLETKAIQFASGLVRDEIKAAREVLKLLGASQNVKGDIGNWIGSLNKDAPPFTALKLEKNARERIAGFLTTIEAASSGIQEEEAWVRQRVERFATDIVKAGEDLKKLGSQYFHPMVEEVEAIIPAVKQLLPDIPSSAVTLFEDYVAGGIEKVRNGTYAELKKVVGQAEAIGQQIKNGVAQPAAVIAGVSREVGAVMASKADELKKLAREAEDLTKSVKDTVNELNGLGKDIGDAIPKAKILGVLDLRKVVGLVARGQMPDMNVIELPDKLQHVWSWNVVVKDYDFGILKFKVNKQGLGGNSFNLRIVSTTTVHLPPPKDLAAGAKPTTEASLEGYLGYWNDKTQKTVPPKAPGYAFALNLLNLIEARFAQVSFTSKYAQGGSPETSVKPELTKVEFLGPMNFIKRLQDLLGLEGFDIDIQPTYIYVGYELDLPPVTTGVFCMRSIKLLTSLSLPFRTDPLRYRFGFSSFAKPFELSVMGFAGRGFVGVQIESNGNRLLEGSLEFGGALSFEIVIASGGLYVMAGVYFKISNTGTELSGYLRAGGFLNVLSLITASVEFILMLRYRDWENALWGICEVTVSIDLGFWSWDEKLTMEKRLAGSGEGQTAQNHRVQSASATAAKLAPPPPPSQHEGMPLPFVGRKSVRGHFASTARWRSDYFNKFDKSFLVSS